jgi:pSer/pThr/pTyr-binding forkhead associated (FHA) protein
MDHVRPTTDPRDAFHPLRLRLHPGDHVVDLTQPDVLLGRHSEADLRMPLPDVSRRHCRFVYSAAGWEVVDLDSLNGVYVNGARVSRTTLHAGDQVRIGGLEFEVEPVAPSITGDVLRAIAETLPAAPALPDPPAPQRKAS